MKKLTLIATITGLFVSQISVHAQGVYFGVGGGYGMHSAVQSNAYNTGATFTSSSYSLGAGISIGVYGGYMVSKNLGFELGIGDKLSSSIATTSSDTGSFGGSTVRTLKGSMLKFTPAIRLMIGDGKLQAYTVTGLIIGMPSATEEDNYTSTFSSTMNSDQVFTYSGGMSIGFHGALGVVYMVADKVGVFAEIAGNLQNWAPSKSVITTYTQGGVDELSKLTTSQKETDFVSSYTASASPSASSPSQSTYIYVPFSSFGISIGLHISLAGSSK